MGGPNVPSAHGSAGAARQEAIAPGAAGFGEAVDDGRGQYLPPKRTECHERSWQTPGDDLCTLRLDNHTWMQGGVLVDFVINLQVLSTDGWVTVEYIDCCHGHCHHHSQNGTDPATILCLDTVDDVRAAFRAAQLVIYERLASIRT